MVPLHLQALTQSEKEEQMIHESKDAEEYLFSHYVDRESLSFQEAVEDRPKSVMQEIYGIKKNGTWN